MSQSPDRSCAPDRSLECMLGDPEPLTPQYYPLAPSLVAPEAQEELSHWGRQLSPLDP